jgi:hypothetical protein
VRRSGSPSHSRDELQGGRGGGLEGNGIFVGHVWNFQAKPLHLGRREGTQLMRLISQSITNKHCIAKNISTEESSRVCWLRTSFVLAET